MTGDQLSVLLVDDQKRELEGIKGLLDWERLGLKIVGEACNGRGGLAMVEALAPDLVITDIVMPDIDGLGMLQDIRRLHPRTKVICISCFNEFKFVSMAINRGASGFVLKPLLASELMGVVERVAAERRFEREDERSARGYAGLRASQDAVRETAAASFAMGKMPPQALLEAAAWPETFWVGYGTGRIAAQSEYQRTADVLLSGPRKETLFFFFHCPDPAAQGTAAPCVAGPCTPENVRSLLPALRQRYHLLRGMDFVPQSVDYPPPPDPIKQRLDLHKALASRDPEEVRAFICHALPPQAFDRLAEAARELLLQAYLLEGAALAPKKTEAPGYRAYARKLAACETRRELLELLEECLHRLMGPREMQDAGSIVTLIQKRVQDKIKEPGQLDPMALLSDIFISAGHANVLFKQETGQTIHQYIRAEKMARAAGLLAANPNAKIQEIAEQCGFVDPAYFINVFKKIYGLTPAQYREHQR